MILLIMKKLFYFILILFMTLSYSCSRHGEYDNEYDPDKAKLELRISPVDAGVEAMGTEPGNSGLNENTVNTLHVFVYPNNAANTQPSLYTQIFTGINNTTSTTFSVSLGLARSSFTQDAMYDVYAIANLPSQISLSQNPTLADLKALSNVSPITSTSLQSVFVMDAKTSVVINPSSMVPVLTANMSLKRATTKVRVNLVLDPWSDVGTATVAQASLRNFAMYGSVLDNNPRSLQPADMSNSAYITGTPFTVFTFYCYENNWQNNQSNETYLMLNIPYGTRSSNYYRVPINKKSNDTRTGKLDRNTIYDVYAYIKDDGSDTEQGVVQVNSNCTVTNWTTYSVVLKTVDQHYLGVNELNVVMPNIATYTLKYVADLPISITNVTASCVQYSSTGSTSTVNYVSGNSQFPTFVISAATGTITVNSAIPINYVPKNITFTVTNNQGLTQNVVITQYPARYVTARLSNGNIKPEWYTGGSNLNLFTVNTLVPSSDGSYTIGDPTNGYKYTDSTAVGNNMVSPRFIIASQYGIYLRVDYPTAQKRCFDYGEDIYRSGWRMPTKAEIELVNRIQDDPNSAVKALLTGTAYWSAYKYDYYDFTNNVWTVSNSSGTAFIRAVYDLYKTEI